MRLKFERDGGGARPRAALADLVYRGIVLTFLTAECSDGRFVQMCARQDSHFRNWLTAIGLAHLLDEERYARAPMGFQSQADLEDMKAQIVARMKTKTQGEWMRIFATEFDVGADPFLLPEEFLDHPQMKENDRVALIQDEDLGAVKEVGQLVEMPATPAEIARPAPRVGSDQQLLSGLARVQEVPTEAAPGPARLPLEGVTIVEFATFPARWRRHCSPSWGPGSSRSNHSVAIRSVAPAWSSRTSVQARRVSLSTLSSRRRAKYWVGS
jgi:hypothetical protein